MVYLKCPTCGSNKLLVYSETAYWINTDEHYCYSIKCHDDNAKVNCTECDWQGERRQFIVVEGGAEYEHNS